MRRAAAHPMDLAVPAPLVVGKVRDALARIATDNHMTLPALTCAHA